MKRKLLLIVLLALQVNVMYGQREHTEKGQKVLVIYFSYTGNTRGLARQIHEQTGGDLVEIELVTPYSKDYKTVEKQGQKEVNTGYQPPLKTKIPNIQSYDVIFIGSPIWWFTISPPVSSFLAHHNLSGKKIVPFLTHGGYGAGHSKQDIRKLAPAAVYLSEYVVEGEQVESTKEKMQEWLKELKIVK